MDVILSLTDDEVAAITWQQTAVGTPPDVVAWLDIQLDPALKTVTSEYLQARDAAHLAALVQALSLAGDATTVKELKQTVDVALTANPLTSPVVAAVVSSP